jgi:hypothetical protein
MDYADGWWEAEQEIRRGEATIYSIGGLRRGDVCLVDRGTGLPIQFVTGCLVRPGDRERVKGHNDCIEQYISQYGLPKNTLKPWENELFNLKQCFEDRSCNDAPKRLHAGGPAAVSPDGRNSVRAIADVEHDGSPSDSLRVIIAAGNAVLGGGYVGIGKGDPDLAWGPEGSRFAVIRSISEKQEYYEAYNLRTGRFLRGETWDEGQRRGATSKRISLPKARIANQVLTES